MKNLVVNHDQQNNADKDLSIMLQLKARNHFLMNGMKIRLSNFLNFMKDMDQNGL
jgi:hypothetical protein